MAKPCTALIDTQEDVGGPFTVTEQFTVPVFPDLSVTKTV